MLKHLGIEHALNLNCPAAFRRLCVETAVSQFADGALIASRLQAAVC